MSKVPHRSFLSIFRGEAIGVASFASGGLAFANGAYWRAV
jgi:hypothetical protein